jgi:hypothetical protein
MLTSDVELLDGMEAAYIRSAKSLVVSDLHLGYEGAMAKRGTFVPKVNLKRILEKLDKAISATGAEKMVVTGDIKHDFSGIEADEFNELYDLINFLKERKVSPILIKGNHDNFVERYKGPFKLAVYGQSKEIGNYLFFHGDELPKIPSESPAMLMMGHEHPTISIANAVGVREKLRCFLYGNYKRIPILVLPEMGYFSSGTDVNLEPKDQLLSPVFKLMDIDRMHAIAVGYGSTIDFGEVSKLRNI